MITKSIAAGTTEIVTFRRNPGTGEYPIMDIENQPANSPATTTIEGGYASNYKWSYSTSYGGPYTTLSETGHSITVSDEGYYKLEMEHDPYVVSDIVLVKNIDIQASISSTTTSGITTFSASINQDLIDDPNLDISYLWEFDGGIPATSTDATPVVTLTGETAMVRLTIMAEANSAGSTGGCSAAIYASLIRIRMCVWEK